MEQPTQADPSTQADASAQADPNTQAESLRSVDAALERLLGDIRALEEPATPPLSRAGMRLVDTLANLTDAASGTTSPRVAAARSFDLFSELVSDVMGMVAGYVDDTLRPTEANDHDLTVRLSGPPGGRAGAPIWIHDRDRAATEGTTLRLTDLTAHDGARLAGTTATFQPGAAESTAGPWPVRLEIAIPAGLAPGVYHGYVLSYGEPEAAIPIRLVVQL